MTFPYPYFNLPYFRRYSRYGYHYPNNFGYPNSHYSQNISSHTSTNKSANSNKVSKDKSTHSIPTLEEVKKEERSSSEEDSPLFQILGINLYFDDILIICLIFFLYQEGVQDESLFIALILLLLS